MSALRTCIHVHVHVLAWTGLHANASILARFHAARDRVRVSAVAAVHVLALVRVRQRQLLPRIDLVRLPVRERCVHIVKDNARHRHSRVP